MVNVISNIDLYHVIELLHLNENQGQRSFLLMSLVEIFYRGKTWILDWSFAYVDFRDNSCNQIFKIVNWLESKLILLIIKFNCSKIYVETEMF